MDRDSKATRRRSSVANKQEPVANDTMPNGRRSVVQHDDIDRTLRQALYVLANRGREIESPRRRRQLRKQNAHVDVAQRATFSAREGSKKVSAINLRPSGSHDGGKTLCKVVHGHRSGGGFCRSVTRSRHK